MLRGILLRTSQLCYFLFLLHNIEATTYYAAAVFSQGLWKTRIFTGIIVLLHVVRLRTAIVPFLGRGVETVYKIFILILSSYCILSRCSIICTLKDIPEQIFWLLIICYQYLLIRLISSFSIHLSGNNGSHLLIPLFFGLSLLYLGSSFIPCQPVKKNPYFVIENASL